MTNCPIDGCSGVKELKECLDKKISLKELSIASAIISASIIAVISTYGYVMEDSLATVKQINAQTIENTISIRENKIEIVNIKNSLMTREEFKNMIKKAFEEVKGK